MVNYDDYYTYREIKEQPKVLERILRGYEIEEVLNLLEYENISRFIFVGCGTSYHIGQISTFIINNLTRYTSFSIPGGEFLFYDITIHKNKTLLFFISRSGETTEVLNSLRKANSSGLETVGVGIYRWSPLIKEAKHVMVPAVGEEKSVVATKFFSGTLLSLLKLITRIDNNSILEGLNNELGKVPSVAKKVIDKEKEIESLVDGDQEVNSITVLGMGQNFGAAAEASLKIKETSYIPTEAFSTLEFRHGPISMANKHLYLIGLIPDTKRFIEEVKVIKESANLGARTWIITNNQDFDDGEIEVFKYPKLNEYLTPVINLIPIHYFAFFRSVKMGYNPDKPRHLSKVVKI